MGPTSPPENRFKPRSIAWHDGPETRSALRSTLGLGVPLTERAELAAAHLAHFAARASAAGRGLDLLAGRRARREKGDAVGEMDGFETFPEAWYSVHPARQRFLADLPAYRRDVRALADARAAEDSSSGSVDGAYHREALLGQIEMIRRAGVEPVLVIPPTLRPVPTLLPATAASEPPRLLAFNDPDAHPELFAEALRLDREHLTAEGTECFSRSLAAAFEARVMAGVEPAGRGHGEL